MTDIFSSLLRNGWRQIFLQWHVCKLLYLYIYEAVMDCTAHITPFTPQALCRINLYLQAMAQTAPAVAPEERITEAIAALPEVKARRKYIEQKSKNKRHIFMMSEQGEADPKPVPGQIG